MIESRQSHRDFYLEEFILKYIDFILLWFTEEKVIRRNQKVSVLQELFEKGKDENGKQVYLLITYELPIVSPRAIPQQVEFFNTFRILKSGTTW